MTTISKKRKFVADGVFYAELNALFERELGPCGYSGVEVRVTPVRTEIIIRATKTLEVVGDKGVRIRQLTSLVQKRWKLSKVELYAERVPNRALCAVAQAESLKFKLDIGLAVRRACYGVLRFIMENGAKGVEIVISGKLRGQRAKAMKFRDGYMIKSGNAVNHYVDSAVRSILLKQGVLGIRVTIMLPHDAAGKQGPSVSLSDVWSIREPAKEEEQMQKQQGFQQQRQQQQQQQQATTTDGLPTATATATALTTTGVVPQQQTLTTSGTPQSPQQMATADPQQQQQSMMVQQGLGADSQATSQSLPQQTMAQVSSVDAAYGALP